jgi:hypothetical protein
VLEKYINEERFTADQLLQIIAAMQKKVSKQNEN